MSIVIPGKMPTECWDCPCAYETEGAHHNYCQAAGYDTKLPDEGRPDWCPLIELPPHGRLGDLDAMLEFVDAGHLRNPLELSWSDADVASMIDSRPTIIPADGGVDNG